MCHKVRTAMVEDVNQLARVEGFSLIIKRGIVETCYKVSKKYLHLYVTEFHFRYNNRDTADNFGTTIRRC